MTMYMQVCYKIFERHLLRIILLNLPGIFDVKIFEDYTQPYKLFFLYLQDKYKMCYFIDIGTEMAFV